jgi:hypothetical protein
MDKSKASTAVIHSAKSNLKGGQKIGRRRETKKREKRKKKRKKFI